MWVLAWTRSLATVGGGQANTASGQASFAVGQYGFAADNYSAVLAFSASNRTCHSMGNSTVNVCADGGLFVNGVRLHDRLNQYLVPNNTAQDQRMAEQAQVIEEQAQVIEDLVNNNTAQDQRMAEQAQVIEDQAQVIEDLVNNNTAQDQRMAEQAQTIKELGTRLSILEAQPSSSPASSVVTPTTVASTTAQCAAKPKGPQLLVEGVCSCQDDVFIGSFSVLQWLSELNASVTSLLV